MPAKIKKLAAGQLTVDPRVQRDHLDEGKLNQMRENYNRDALGTLQISERSDGDYIILDGWHRWTLIKELEGDSYSIQCLVFSNLSLADEAALFLDFNRQGAASKLDKFNVRVIQDDVVAVEIKEMVLKNNWGIGTSDGQISAVDTLETIYKLGEKFYPGYGKQLVFDTIRVITDAWGHADRKAVDKNLLGALGYFILHADKYFQDSDDHQLDRTKLATNMAQFIKNGPSGFLESCRGWAKGTSKTLRQILLNELYDTYNRGRGRRLPGALMGR